MWNPQPRHNKATVARKPLDREPLPVAAADARNEQELRECIRRHKVYWKAWPEFHVSGFERRQVGFRLGLFGTHDRPSKLPIAGCPECWKVYRCLQDLARCVLPVEERESDLQIGVFDATLLYNGARREILVTIKVTHQNGFDRPVDACEERALGAPRFRKEILVS